MKKSAVVLVSALLLSLGSAFAQSTSPAGGAAAGASAQSAPTDPQIAHIMTTANRIDIAGGKLAQSNAADKEVQAFGRQMVTDHTAANREAEALTKRLKITPEDNPSSKTLQSSADSTMARLKGLKGKEFDKAYIDNEVTFHQTVLDAIDTALLPNAKNGELKDLITKTRPNIAMHLERAKQIQSSLK